MTKQRLLDVARNPDFWLALVIFAVAVFFFSGTTWAQPYSYYQHFSNPHTFYTPTGPSNLSSAPLVLPQRNPAISMAPEGREHPPFRYITYKEGLEEKENPFLTVVRDMRWKEKMDAEKEQAARVALCETDKDGKEAGN